MKEAIVSYVFNKTKDPLKTVHILFFFTYRKQKNTIVKHELGFNFFIWNGGVFENYIYLSSYGELKEFRSLYLDNLINKYKYYSIFQLKNEAMKFLGIKNWRIYNGWKVDYYFKHKGFKIRKILYI